MLCPRCDYDLTGLPAEHTCPECGCKYDEHSIGIPLTGRRAERWWAWVFQPLLGVILLIQVQRSGVQWRTWDRLILPVIIFLGFFLQWKHRLGFPTRMVLDREGVELITPAQEPLRWGWNEIRRANVDWAFGRFYLVSVDETFLISRSYRRLGSLKLVKKCAAEINERIGLYRTVSQDVPES